MAVRTRVDAEGKPTAALQELFKLPTSEGSVMDVDASEVGTENAGKHVRKSTRILQYPSVASAGPYLAVADGSGMLFLLRWLGDEQAPPTVIGHWTHQPEATCMAAGGQPCSVLDMASTTDGDLLLLLQDTKRPLSSDVESGAVAPTTTFRVSLVRIPVEVSEDGAVACELVHQVEARDPPYYAYFEPDTADAYVLGGRAAFAPVVSPTAPANAEDAMQLDVVPPTAAAATAESLPPAPYTWTQTDDGDLTVCYMLSAPVHTSQIRCSFTASTLTLAIEDGPADAPHALERRFYESVLPDECLWTLESGRLLTLHLQKGGKAAGGPIRWQHVFAEDDGVLETLDSSILVEIRDRLAKYTVDTSNSEEKTQAELVTAAATGLERQLEAEDEEGEAAVFARILCTPAVAQVTHRAATSGQDWLAASFRERVCLNAPSGESVVPASSMTRPSIPRLPAVCLRRDVDGLVYELGAGEQQAFHARHAATFDAFGFVQASKRDRRFITFGTRAHHVAVTELRRRTYVYQRAPTRRSAYAQQLVLDLADDYTDILGVQAVVTTAGGDEGLLLLTEMGLHVMTLAEPDVGGAR
ncbi:hypothetical protein THASP1DRAFT_21976 [Thamnocephalis sphaerospora]|uniref:NudC domain-containing protein 1 n=1 Tax=Thamnocephalis sphaerospora TaxID=78915 RepID=A0A4P9XVI8_9FUNG|nr:hypothetical protein THASP1DRAFT_21976 [Thamnocephalis sphaerospora]|eukprot:RKP10283.1 hypothetical protein THASP1DRAFT_21976 [Thamnocephalis sphaerospora]